MQNVVYQCCTNMMTIARSSCVLWLAELCIWPTAGGPGGIKGATVPVYTSAPLAQTMTTTRY